MAQTQLREELAATQHRKRMGKREIKAQALSFLQASVSNGTSQTHYKIKLIFFQ